MGNMIIGEITGEPEQRNTSLFSQSQNIPEVYSVLVEHRTIKQSNIKLFKHKETFCFPQNLLSQLFSSCNLLVLLKNYVFRFWLFMYEDLFFGLNKFKNFYCL